LTSVRRV